MAPKIPKSHGKTPIGGVWLGGFSIVIYVGKDGQLHIKRVPPGDPAPDQLNIAAALTSHAATIGDKDIARQCNALAQTILDNYKEQILALISS